jgi:arabinan endo-1,5-alpha-L-arabinosidase
MTAANMIITRHSLIFSACVSFLATGTNAQTAPAATPAASAARTSGSSGFGRGMPDSTDIVKLSTIHAQDVCIYPDEKTKTYYMVAAGGGSVRSWTSKNLIDWQGPKTIFRPPADIWGDIHVTGIWAPELHEYKGKYYLFLTFDSRHLLGEQWHDWRPRVTRGSQILWSDSPDGPYHAFASHSTAPPDMMTLDGTFWVEDGVPYMIFCNEWVQISDGTIEYMPLKDDLSDAAGPPKRMFRGSDAKWSELIEAGGHVTDGPYAWKGKTGKLYLIWSSRAHDQTYKLGIAISDSGKLAGPWRQQDEPIFKDNGGHGMIFNTFDGKLMLILHTPDGRQPDGRRPQPHIFELTDTGETLKIVKELTASASEPTEK